MMEKDQLTQKESDVIAKVTTFAFQTFEENKIDANAGLHAAITMISNTLRMAGVKIEDLPALADGIKTSIIESFINQTDDMKSCRVVDTNTGQDVPGFKNKVT